MKRFTETTEWDKEWFQDLPWEYKLFWKYVRDKADNAGVWRVNMRLASFQVGKELDSAEALKLFAGRVEDIGDSKWWIVGFVSFQYGTLTDKCAPHRKVMQLLEQHGLTRRVGLG